MNVDEAKKITVLADRINTAARPVINEKLIAGLPADLEKYRYISVPLEVISLPLGGTSEVTTAREFVPAVVQSIENAIVRLRSLQEAISKL